MTNHEQPHHPADNDDGERDSETSYAPRHLDTDRPDQHQKAEHDQIVPTPDLRPSIGLDPEHRPRGPSIWVVDEPGAHLGHWLPATGTSQQVRARIGDGMIDDVVGFGNFNFQHGDSPEIIAAVANGIAIHGEAFAAWAELHDGDLSMLSAFKDAYLGEYANPADWAIQTTGAQHILNELGMEIGELIEFFHFDAEAFVEDAYRTGQIWIERPDERRCWVFTTG